MGSFKSQLQNLDTLKELNLIHHQIDNMNSDNAKVHHKIDDTNSNTVKVKVHQLNKITVKPKTPLNIKELFRVAVNEFRQKIDTDRKMMHGNIA